MTPEGADQTDQRAVMRRFRYGFIVATLLYIGLVYLSDYVIDANPDANWRYAMAVLPAVPVAVCVVALVPYYNRLLDELQQRIQLEAIAFAFLGTLVIAFGYGLLEVAGLPGIAWKWAWVLMVFLWLIGDSLARRRRL